MVITVSDLMPVGVRNCNSIPTLQRRKQAQKAQIINSSLPLQVGFKYWWGKGDPRVHLSSLPSASGLRLGFLQNRKTRIGMHRADLEGDPKHTDRSTWE